MSIRVTMSQTRLGEAGTLLNSGSTYTVSDDFGTWLIGRGFATDTDALLPAASQEQSRIAVSTTRLAALVAAGELVVDTVYVVGTDWFRATSPNTYVSVGAGTGSTASDTGNISGGTTLDAATVYYHDKWVVSFGGVVTLAADLTTSGRMLAFVPAEGAPDFTIAIAAGVTVLQEAGTTLSSAEAVGRTVIVLFQEDGKVRVLSGLQVSVADKLAVNAGGVAANWSGDFGVLTIPAPNAGEALALDSGVLVDGVPGLKITPSTTASAMLLGRYTPTNPVSFANFTNIAIKARITCAESTAAVATAAAPFGVWLKTASGKQFRLRLDASGAGPGGEITYSWTRSEVGTTLTFAGGATWAALDTETITAIDFVHTNTATPGSAYPIWLGPLKVNSQSTPVLSLRLDGGYASQYTFLFPLLQKHGIKASMALIHSRLGTAGYMTAAQVSEMYVAGHEVILHCFAAKNAQGYANATDYPDAASITNDVVSGFAAAKSNGWTRGLGVLVEGFTGNYYGGATTAARQRLVKAGLSAAGVNLFCTLNTNVTMQNSVATRASGIGVVRSNVSVGASTTYAAMTAAIDQAIANGEGFVPLLHEIVADAATPVGSQSKVSDVDAWLAYAASKIRAGQMASLPISATYLRQPG